MRPRTATIRWTAALGLGLSVGAGAVAGGSGAAEEVRAGSEAAHAAEATQSASSPRLLVLLRDASALAVVDPATGTVLGQVPTVRGPHEVTATPGRTAGVRSQPQRRHLRDRPGGDDGAAPPGDRGGQ